MHHAAAPMRNTVIQCVSTIKYDVSSLCYAVHNIIMRSCTVRYRMLSLPSLLYRTARVHVQCALRTHDDDGVVKRGSVDAVRQMVDECAI